MGNHKPRTSNLSGATPRVPLAAHKIASSSSISAFDTDLLEALLSGDVSAARSLVADAEAALMTSDNAAPAKGNRDRPSRAHLAGAKARIAMSIGDHLAARAILVQAIERWPDVPFLPALMTEVMMASGRARDVRPVLTHLGQTVAPQPPAHTQPGRSTDSVG